MFIDSRDLRLLAAQGLTMREIALKLKVPFVRVRRAFAYYLDVPVATESAGRPTKVTDPNIERLRELHAQGKSRAEAMKSLGVCRSTLRVLETAAGVTLAHGNKRGLRDAERAEKMVRMYLQGVTLAKIGETFNITRERVRQILKKNGINGKHGGVRVSAQHKRDAHKSAVNARSIIKYGLPCEEMNDARSKGLVSAYRYQKNSAAARDVPWGLTFAQWLHVWTLSGKIEQRGRGKGKYCMSRIKDTGGYVLGNVHIQLSTDNSRDAIAKWKGKTKAVRGVFLLYPGLSKPYLAKAGKKVLGLFATEEEAAQARRDFAVANGYCFSARGLLHKAA